MATNYIDQFDKSLSKHIENVRIAGRALGVPYKLLAEHDISKYSYEEHDIYARHFFGGGDPIHFPSAWLHHIHNNPHHWQYWIFPDGWTTGYDMDGPCVEMPYEYVLEMVADWIGSSMTYTGSNDISDWLSKNIQKIAVHRNTADLLRNLLDSLGYADVVYVRSFKNEGSDAE